MSDEDTLQYYLDECDKKTCASSSLQYQRENEYYQRAKEMGPGIIPILLKNLAIKNNSGKLIELLLLGDLAESDPVIPKEDHGKINKIIELWIQWGKDQGFYNDKTDK